MCKVYEAIILITSVWHCFCFSNFKNFLQYYSFHEKLVKKSNKKDKRNNNVHEIASTAFS